MDILIKNVTYLSPDYTDWTDGDILIKDGRISKIGSIDAGLAGSCEIIEGKGKIAIPGFINAHAHSYTGYLKGSIDNIPLDIYMLYAIAGGSFRTPREIYISTMVEAMQMLRHGTTSVTDHFSQRPSLSAEGIDAAAQAFNDIGMRANIATMFADLSFFDTIPMLPGELPAELRGKPSGKPQSAEEYALVVEDAFKKYNEQGGNVRIILGTDGPQRCSKKLLTITRDLEEKYKMGWQTHILEAKTQAIISRQLYGKGLIEYMDEMGLINERTSLVHFVWVSDDEIDIVRKRGANVVHCPSSNLHLGSGVTPADLFLRSGINVALGSDGGNCGHTGMLERIRLTALLHKASQPDYEQWISAEDALRMNYEGGSRVMMRDTLGKISVGSDGDLILINTGNILWQPANNLTRQLVFAENGSNIDTVLVGGEKVFSEGRYTSVNETDIISEAKEIAARLKKDNAESFALVEKQLPYFRQMYMREIRKNIGFNRFIRPLE